MLIGLVETVVVDKVSRKNGYINLDVHAKYDDSQKWQIKKVSSDLKICKDWELNLWSPVKSEYVKRDTSMMDYINVIDADRINAKGKFEKRYVLYKRFDGSYSRRTAWETRQNNNENTAICFSLLEAACNRR